MAGIGSSSSQTEIVVLSMLRVELLSVEGEPWEVRRIKQNDELIPWRFLRRPAAVNKPWNIFDVAVEKCREK